MDDSNLDLIFHNNFWWSIKRNCKQNSKLRIHTKPDRNQSKLTVCIASPDYLFCYLASGSLKTGRSFHQLSNQKFKNKGGEIILNENICRVLENHMRIFRDNYELSFFRSKVFVRISALDTKKRSIQKDKGTLLY